MASIDGALLDLRRMERLADGGTALHLMDPRAKVLVTLFFIITVVSYGSHAVTGMLPLFVFPVIMVSLGELPLSYLAKKIALLTPFALVAGVLNPFFDREILYHFGSWSITGGWVSFASIALRSLLTLGSAMILVALTGLPAICRALEQLGTPRLFVIQLNFLHRYLFVLMEEGAKVSLARELRANKSRGREIGSFVPLIGNLLLRTWRRGERVHAAMLARGFTGEFRHRRECNFGRKEVIFVVGWLLFFIVVRTQNLPQILGKLVTGNIP